jgi:hypothetical protein
MSARSIDRSTLKILGAKRLWNGVHLTATFEAPKTSGGVGGYTMTIRLNPASGAVESIHPTLHKPDGGVVDQTRHSKDTQWDLAKDLTAVFLKSEAWKILRDREPDRTYRIDKYGREIGRRSKAAPS